MSYSFETTLEVATLDLQGVPIHQIMERLQISRHIYHRIRETDDYQYVRNQLREKMIGEYKHTADTNEGEHDEH